MKGSKAWCIECLTSAPERRYLVQCLGGSRPGDVLQASQPYNNNQQLCDWCGCLKLCLRALLSESMTHNLNGTWKIILQMVMLYVCMQPAVYKVVQYNLPEYNTL